MSKKRSEIRESSDKELYETFDKVVGKGALRRLGDAGEMEALPRVPSSSMGVNLILDGGIPYGRIVQIVGPPSSGKTTLMLDFVAHAQKVGEVGFIDAEHSLDPEWATKQGVNVDKLWMLQPDNGEQAIEGLRVMVGSGKFRMVVIDSIPALVPLAELEGEVGEAHMGRQARLIAQMLRMIKGLASKNQCAVILINQTRKNLSGYGVSDQPSGGEALRFYSDITINLAFDEVLKDSDMRVGQKVKLTTVKNKTGQPYRICKLIARYKIGLDFVQETVEIALEKSLIEQSGAWFTFEDRKFQGMNSMVEEFRSNTELYTRLLTNVRKVVSI